MVHVCVHFHDSMKDEGPCLGLVRLCFHCRCRIWIVKRSVICLHWCSVAFVQVRNAHHLQSFICLVNFVITDYCIRIHHVLYPCSSEFICSSPIHQPTQKLGEKWLFADEVILFVVNGYSGVVEFSFNTLFLLFFVLMFVRRRWSLSIYPSFS